MNVIALNTSMSLSDSHDIAFVNSDYLTDTLGDTPLSLATDEGELLGDTPLSLATDDGGLLAGIV
ncbi:MAG: hypothetical protein F6K28_60305 [Microcoleus sp. SIO2G3]|nr:hypothetical protein [Microcoleus sp. SIO2G3]